jgi:glucose dehydrogenase
MRGFRYLFAAVGLSLAPAWVLPLSSVAISADSVAPPFRNSEKDEDGQWLTAAKDYANTRFSGLKEITPENVSQL